MQVPYARATHAVPAPALPFATFPPLPVFTLTTTCMRTGAVDVQRALLGTVAQFASSFAGIIGRFCLLSNVSSVTRIEVMRYKVLLDQLIGNANPLAIVVLLPCYA